jgi:hypothetical protein
MPVQANQGGLPVLAIFTAAGGGDLAFSAGVTEKSAVCADPKWMYSMASGARPRGA